MFHDNDERARITLKSYAGDKTHLIIGRNIFADPSRRKRKAVEWLSKNRQLLTSIDNHIKSFKKFCKTLDNKLNKGQIVELAFVSTSHACNVARDGQRYELTVYLTQTHSRLSGVDQLTIHEIV